MLEIKDVEKLAKLARISLTEDEKTKLLKEIDPILDYVAKLKEVSGLIDEKRIAGDLRNITRDDSVSTTIQNTEDLVAEMPESKNNYLKVKKVL